MEKQSKRDTSEEQAKSPPPQEKKASLEDTLSELAKYQLELSKSQAQFVNETRTSLTNQATQLRNLEVQMGQMGKSITLRSGKTMEKPVQVSGGESNAGNGENNAEIEESSVGISGSIDEKC